MLPVEEKFVGKKILIGDNSVGEIPGYSNTNLDIISQNIRTTQAVGYKYPGKEVHVIYIEYNNDQHSFFSSINALITKKTKWWSEYAKNLDDARNFLLRCIGNYSEDVDKFTSKYEQGTTPDGFYPTFVNKIADKGPTLELQTEFATFNQKRGQFSCPKFQKIFLHLLLMKTGLMLTKDGITEQPHLTVATPRVTVSGRPHNLGNNPYDNENWVKQVGIKNPGTNLWEPRPYNQCTHYYLPLVYSCSDILGSNLFASFIKSYGFDFIILNSNEPEEIVNREKLRANNKTYPLYLMEIRQRILKIILDSLLTSSHTKLDDIIVRILGIIAEQPGNIYSEPICVFLSADMTEGIDSKFNPAIFLMEPPNTYGDYDQLCGRVLRTYSEPYAVEPQKMIYQFACYNNSDMEKIYDNRAWSKSEIRAQDRLFYDDSEYISQSIRTAYEQRKENFSTYKPKNSMYYFKKFGGSNLSWEDYFKLMRLSVKTNILEHFSLSSEEREKINVAINKQFEMFNLKSSEQASLYDIFSGELGFKGALYNARIERNNIALQTFFDKYNYVYSDQGKATKTIKDAEIARIQYENERKENPDKETFYEFDQALNELQNNQLDDSTSPDLNRMQKIQEVEFFVNLIKNNLSLPEGLPDLKIIQKKAASRQNSQYLPWFDPFFKSVSWSCDKLKLFNNAGENMNFNLTQVNQQNYSQLTQQFITDVNNVYSPQNLTGQNMQNRELMNENIQSLTDDINNINQNITFTFTEGEQQTSITLNPLLIQPPPGPGLGPPGPVPGPGLGPPGPGPGLELGPRRGRNRGNRGGNKRTIKKNKKYNKTKKTHNKTKKTHNKTKKRRLSITKKYKK
jgi:hypothetical protein